MWISEKITKNKKSRPTLNANVSYSNGYSTSVCGSNDFADIDKIAPYGIAYVPPRDERAVVIPVGRGQVCAGVVCSNFASVKPGELMLFSEGGAKILLKNDGSVVINGQVFSAEET